MPKDFSAQHLVEDLKLRVSMPTTQPLYSTAQLVQLMSNELQDTIVPAITSAREDYFVQIVDVPIDVTTNRYRIPTRAIGGGLRDVVLLDASEQEVELPRLTYDAIKNNPARTNNRLFGFYIENDSVVLFPEDLANVAGYQLRFRIERLPGDLVLKSEASTIIAINPTLQQVTVSSAPSSWTTSTKFDFIHNEPLFISLGDDYSINSIVTNVLTFDDPLPTDLALGMWVVETRFSPVPQIPYNAFGWLAQLGGVKALEGLTDPKGLDNAYAAATRLENKFIKTLTPRVKGSTLKVNNRNGILDWSSGFGSRRRGVW